MIRKLKQHNQSYSQIQLLFFETIAQKEVASFKTNLFSPCRTIASSILSGLKEKLPDPSIMLIISWNWFDVHSIHTGARHENKYRH